MPIKYTLGDREIRSFLIERIYQAYLTPDTIVIEELDLCIGEARIDLALVNCASLGIEIKSDRDTLNRLPKQIEIYSKIFDKVEIVSGPKLFKEIVESVPEWWGISTVSQTNRGSLKYRKWRKSRKNINKDPLSNAQLLWKSEIIELLKIKAIEFKFKNKSKEFLCNALIELAPHKEVFTHVNSCLKSRKDWRFVHRLK